MLGKMHRNETLGAMMNYNIIPFDVALQQCVQTHSRV